MFLPKCYVLTVFQASGAEKATNVISDVNDEEKKLLEPCKTGLKGSIGKGIEFVHNPPPK